MSREGETLAMGLWSSLLPSSPTFPRYRLTSSSSSSFSSFPHPSLVVGSPVRQDPPGVLKAVE